MQINLKNRTLAELTIGLIYTGIGILGFVIAHFSNAFIAFIPPCLFRRYTGLPCPSCGATRAGIELSFCRLGDALAENPLFFLLYCALILWGMNTMLGVVLGKNVQIILATREKKLVQKLLVSAIIINWLYLVGKTII